MPDTKRWLVALVFALMLVAGGACSSDSGSSSSGRATSSTPNQTLAESSIGYKIAVIDGGNPSGESDPQVILLNGLVRELARRCSDADAERVADYAVTGRRLLRENYGIEATVWGVLNGIDAGTAGQTGMNCADIAAAFVTITGASR